MKAFKAIETQELRNIRNGFRDNYTYIENYCKDKYNTGNYLDLLARDIDLKVSCKNEVLDLIKLDYIRSNNYNFEISPAIENATNFLRNELLEQDNKHNYNKGFDRAVLVLLQTIRDNITHYGKFEHSEIQFNRNFSLVKNAFQITNTIIDKYIKTT